LEHNRRKPYSQKACRDNVGKQIAVRQAKIRNLRAGKEPSSGEWALAIDAWIEVVEEYSQRQQTAKDRATENQAQVDRLRTIRNNMKRRMGEKEGPEENNSGVRLTANLMKSALHRISLSATGAKPIARPPRTTMLIAEAQNHARTLDLQSQRTVMVDRTY
jgi:hypothetical protein